MTVRTANSRPQITRIGIAGELLLVAALAGLWIMAWAAAERSIGEMPPGSRNFVLRVWETSSPLWLSLVLGLVGVAMLTARHWVPIPAFIAVAAIVVVVENWFLFIAGAQFGSKVMLTVAAFWAMWKTRHVAAVAVTTVLVAAATTFRAYSVNESLEALGSSASPLLRSLSGTAQNVLLAGAAIGGALLIRRFDRQAHELADRNAELTAGREAASRAAVLDERVRIARELHDVVAHHVTTMTVHAGAARQVVHNNPEAAVDSLRQIETSGRDAVTELHRILGFLRGSGDERAEQHGGDPSDRSPVPSLRYLEQLCASVDSRIDCELTVTGDVSTLSPSVDVSAYRIVQEALTNAMKHGSADRADVIVEANNREVHVQVLDNGASSESAENGSGTGHGLIGMRERVGLHGGSIEVGPANGGGWMVNAHLPNRANA